MNKSLCAVLITLFSLPCQGMTEYTSDLICPIGGEKFEAVLAGSGTSFGKYLDLKPYGPTPAPWPIAKCPSNGFVIFKDSFTPTEREKLKLYVETEQYQLLQKQYSNYYLAAKLKENLGAAKRDIAHTLLQATWEVKNEEEYVIYATEALNAFNQILARKYDNQDNWVTDQLVAGELERRIGNFSASKARFTILSKNPIFQTGIFSEIVKLQISLNDSKNKNSEKIPQKSILKPK